MYRDVREVRYIANIKFVFVLFVEYRIPYKEFCHRGAE